MLASIGRESDPIVGPLEVMVDFCNSCNMHCLCCYNYSPLSPCRFDAEERKHHFPPDLFIQLLDDCAALGVNTINLAGYGEPLTHPECEKLLGEIRKRRLKASITTNGTLLTRYPKLTELLSSAVISIQAGSAECYARMHPIDPPQRWQHVLNGLQMLHTAHIPKTFAFVLCSENYRDLPALVDLAGTYDANIDIQPIRPFIRKEEGKAEFDPDKLTMLRLTESHLTELLDQQQELNQRAAAKGVTIYGLDDFLALAARKRTGDPDARVEDPAEAFYKQQPCYVGWYFTRILMDGSVTPCCQCVGRITLGNINERPFTDIWLSSDYRRFRTDSLHVPLSETDIWARCQCGLCDSVTKNRRVHERLTATGLTGTLIRLAKPLFQRKAKSENKTR